MFPVSTRSVLLGPCMFLAAACTAPRPNPYVVTPKPGETLTSISGPMPDFGTYTSVSDALLAACPVIIGQPHALIPVSRDHQNFGVYWRTASEYCAWLYSIDGAQVDMSLMTTSPSRMIRQGGGAICQHKSLTGATPRPPWPTS